jgi:quercetin dioxygenase-like cupin family protein
MELYTWDEMEKDVLSETFARRIISGDSVMVAQIFCAKGAIVPEHFHESEQISYVVEGALKIELEGKEVLVRQGQVLRIPSNVPHSAVALEETYGLDIFSPIRHDWLNKQDDYLRRK